MRRRRIFLTGFVLVVVGMLAWQQVQADVPAFTHPAQVQIRQILPILQDSEAEHVMGAYIPGIGATLVADMIRGPNHIAGKESAAGVRDWSIFMLQTYGAQLEAVPAEETISLSVEFYDYGLSTYHQLVIVAPRLGIADPATYVIWLNGRPYAEVMGEAIAAVPTLVISAEPTATAMATPPPEPTATSIPPTTTPPLEPTPQPTSEWATTAGTWSVVTDGTYQQEALDLFDLISYRTDVVQGDYRWQTEMQLIEGEMGAGLVWNAPTATQKNEGNMASFTANGTFLQWGVYDAVGSFQYTGGITLDPPIQFDEWHTLAVVVAGDQFTILFDDIPIAENIAMTSRDESYVGLLVSTSAVRFRNTTLTAVSP